MPLSKTKEKHYTPISPTTYFPHYPLSAPGNYQSVLCIWTYFSFELIDF